MAAARQAAKQANKKVLGNVLKLPAVRLSFPDLFTPTAFEEGQVAKYGASFLLDPKNPRHKKAIEEIKAEEKRMIKEAWGAAPAKLVIEYCGNGNDRTSQQTGEIYQGYEDMWFISCKNSTQPLVLDQDKVEVAQNDKRVYGGAFVNATINLFVQDNKYGKGIRASVRAVQVLGYGEPFGQHVTAKEFEDFDTDDEGLAMGEDDGL